MSKTPRQVLKELQSKLAEEERLLGEANRTHRPNRVPAALAPAPPFASSSFLGKSSSAVRVAQLPTRTTIRQPLDLEGGCRPAGFNVSGQPSRPRPRGVVMGGMVHRDGEAPTFVVPVFPLSDALLFHGVDLQLCDALSETTSLWEDTIVCTAELWEAGGFLATRPIDVMGTSIPPLARRSMEVFPDRTVTLTASASWTEWKKQNGDSEGAADGARVLPVIEKDSTLLNVRHIAVRDHRLDWVEAFPHRESLDLTGRYVKDYVALSLAASGIQHLNLGNVTSLRDLRSIAPNPCCLRTLDLTGCSELKNIDTITTMTTLEEVILSRTKVEVVAPLGELPNLTALDVSQCRRMANLDGLGTSKSLKCLLLNHCRDLEDVSSLASLPSILCLEANGCEQVRDLSPLFNLRTLQRLALDHLSDQATAASDLSNLTNLFDLSMAHNVFPNFALSLGLLNLASLDLSCCTLPFFAPGERTLPALCRLNLRDSDCSIDLTCCPALVELDVSGKPIGDLLFLKATPELKILRAARCPVADLTALPFAPLLEDLDLSKGVFSSLRGMEQLSHLRRLALSYNLELTDTQALACLGRLRELALVETGVIEITALASATQLRTVDLTGSYALISLAPLAQLPFLTSVEFEGCWSVTEIPETAFFRNRGMRGDAGGSVGYWGPNQVFGSMEEPTGMLNL